MEKSTTNDCESKELGRVIHIDEGKIQDHLGEMVRRSVEEALNGMLDAEADPACVMPGVTSVPRSALIPVRGITSASCIRRLGRLI